MWCQEGHTGQAPGYKGSTCLALAHFTGCSPTSIPQLNYALSNLSPLIFNAPRGESGLSQHGSRLQLNGTEMARHLQGKQPTCHLNWTNDFSTHLCSIHEVIDKTRRLVAPDWQHRPDWQQRNRAVSVTTTRRASNNTYCDHQFMCRPPRGWPDSGHKDPRC